jgi:phosphorylase kinase alpha/beta subunit
MAFFGRYRHRFDDIISGAADPCHVANRPHVRFDGRSLSEISGGRWAHAQNDALGYFLWLLSPLARSGAGGPGSETISMMATLVRYFDAIRFWQDEDSGHWGRAAESVRFQHRNRGRRDRGASLVDARSR